MDMDYLIAVIRRAWMGILFIYAIAITWAYAFKPVELTPVIGLVQSNGKVVYSNDPNSQWQYPILKDRMTGLLDTLWKYKIKGFKPYSVSYVEFRDLVKPKSKAYFDLSKAVNRNIGGKKKTGNIRTESSQYEVDWNTFRVKRQSIKSWEVKAELTRYVTPLDGKTDQAKYIFKTIIEEGTHDAIYQVSSYTITPTR